MKYWCYNDPIFNAHGTIIGNEVKVFSEEEIIATYFPYWYQSMCERFGKEEVDMKYTKEDCIGDWVVINWAWESKNV